MQQSEELFKAAERSGAASSPLLLFYGLSQAGRAIAAAALNTNAHEWELSGHGIKASRLSGPLPNIVLVAAPSAASTRKPSFERLSLILGSPLWKEADAPTLFQVWDTLPELSGKPLTADADRRVPLLATIRQTPEGNPRVAAHVAGFPRHLAGAHTRKADLDAFMVDYPTAAGYIPELDQIGHPAYKESLFGTALSLDLYWEADPPSESTDESVRQALLDKSLTHYREGELYLFPRVLPGEGPLHPLLAWWAVLYALSMLARYQPAEWISTIDINSSPYANAVEFLLQEALTVVPDLVLTAISRVTRR